MGLLSAGISEVGLKRKTNQDSIFLNPQKKIFIVADGMGGHKGGDIASALAVKAAPEFILENISKDAEDLLLETIAHTNKTIKEKSEENPDWKGMGTTFCLFYFKGPNLYIANVGDSRGYLIHDKKLYQLTKDHTFVFEKINMGLYTREQAKADPQKHILTRTVGFEDKVDPDIFTYKTQKNDIFLICSDGLSGYVSDRDTLFLINKHVPDPDNATEEILLTAAKALVDQANANGGGDNISVVLILAQKTIPRE
jgi:PPM family protein phosphatase